MSGAGISRLPLRRISTVALLLGLIATLTAAWATRAAVQDQEGRLLRWLSVSLAANLDIHPKIG